MNTNLKFLTIFKTFLFMLKISHFILHFLGFVCTYKLQFDLKFVLNCYIEICRIILKNIKLRILLSSFNLIFKQFLCNARYNNHKFNNDQAKDYIQRQKGNTSASLTREAPW